MAEGRGFRPLHFGTPSAAERVPVEPATTISEATDDPFAKKLVFPADTTDDERRRVFGVPY